MTYKDRDIEYVHGLVQSGAIGIFEGNEIIMTIKEKQVKKIHTNAINVRTNGRYITKVKDNNKTIQISAETYPRLIEKLYTFYFGSNTKTLEYLYTQWLEYRVNDSAVTAKTIKENKYLWNAYLSGHSITQKPLNSLKPKDFIIFFRSITKNRSMTRKRFNDVKSVLNGIMYYAIEQDIIEHNPLNDINYNQFSYKAENTEIIPYTESERQQIIDSLSDSNDIYDLAVMLSFYFTIRIGELKGLRFDDIQGDFIHVCRFVNEKHEVVEHIKGNSSVGFRWLPLTAQAKNVISRIHEINPDSDYLFKLQDNPQKFITTVTFNRHIKHICDILGIQYRSSHKVRFSTASILNQKGVSVSELQGLLGHTTPTMTHHYLRNVSTRQETLHKVSDILE